MVAMARKKVSDRKQQGAGPRRANARVRQAAATHGGPVSLNEAQSFAKGQQRERASERRTVVATVPPAAVGREQEKLINPLKYPWLSRDQDEVGVARWCGVFSGGSAPGREVELPAPRGGKPGKT